VFRTAKDVGIAGTDKTNGTDGRLTGRLVNFVRCPGFGHELLEEVFESGARDAEFEASLEKTGANV